MKISFKRVLLFGGVVLLLFVAYMAYQLLTPSGPIAISPQTTVITEPLADDGLPDYAAHVLGKMNEGVTPKNNGAIPYLQAMWPAELDIAQQQVVCTELGMDMPPTDGMQEPYSDKKLITELTAWYKEQQLAGKVVDEEELRHWVQEELVHHFQVAPWTADDAPAMVDWLERNEPYFALLHEAAECEKYYLPPTALLTDPQGSLIHILLPHVQSLRSAVRCLGVRANYHIGSGELDAAWDDCLTMYGLAASSSGQALVGDLVSIACESTANGVTLEILDSAALTPELAKRIQPYLQSRPPRDSMRATIDEFERLLFVTAILEMSGERQSANPNAAMGAPSLGPLAGVAHLAIDWNLMLTIGNGWYDQIVAALALPTHAERRAAIDAIDAKLAKGAALGPGAIAGSVFSRRARTQQMANVFSSMLLPAVNAAVGAENRANTQLRLLQTAAAEAVYRVENGTVSRSLDALVPQLLPTAPIDTYGNPLVYKPADNGYLLYSLGQNGQDEAGSNEAYSTYKGYETSDIKNEDQDRALRELLDEPAAEAGGDELDYEFVRAPKDADDWALRLPLPERPIPEYEPAAE